MILGTPFISLLKPFIVTDEEIITKILRQKIIFNFISKPKEKIINFLNKEINNLISNKQNQIEFLKEEIDFRRIEERVRDPYVTRKILNTEKEIAETICAEIPNAFWQRKQHTVSLLCEKDFKEKDIPTKVRPIQMNYELLVHSKKEINDLLIKGLIRKSQPLRVV